MNLDKFRKQATAERQKFEAVRSYLVKRGDLTDKAKFEIEGRARAEYDQTLADIAEQALAALAGERSTLVERGREVEVQRWARFRAVLGDAGAAIIFAEQVKQADYPHRLEMWHAGDEWARAIIEALTPTATPANPAEVITWHPLANAIRQSRGDDARDLVQQGRDLDQAERGIVDLDTLAARTRTWDLIDTPSGVRDKESAPLPFSDLSVGAQSDAERAARRLSQ